MGVDIWFTSFILSQSKTLYIITHILENVLTFIQLLVKKVMIFNSTHPVIVWLLHHLLVKTLNDLGNFFYFILDVYFSLN